MKGFIIDNDYSSDESGTTVQLFGRLENGESFVVNNKFVPYFFIEAKNQKKLGNLLKQFEVEKTNLTTFSGEEVLKISHVSFQKLGILIKAIHAKEIRSFESDIRPNMRYIIDFDLKGGIEIEGDYESSERVDRVYNNAKIFPSDFVSKLKILSIDTESGSDGKLFCIGMYSEGFEKEFMVGKGNIPGVNFCKDEETCLEKFRESVLEFDPDIITGWNLISFDLQYLQGLFRKYKMNFDIARTNENLRLKIETNFFKSSSANLVGRQVIDGLNLIKDPFIQEAPSIKNSNFESYTLENVSQVILKKGKLLKGNNRHEEIESLYNSGSEKSLKKLADYNLLDCKLVYEILEKTKMIDLGLERVQLTGMTLDRLTASIAAFDSVYFREARKRGLVSPATIFGNKEQKLKGGYVFSLKPGVYHNVLIFDFKSLYPSIIKTFNIDPASYLGNSHKGEKKYVEAPNKVFFRNSEGILPDIIQNLHLAREKAKKEKRELSSYAIKIIMNSFWGVLASPNCRYFDFNMASAITSFAREIIQLTAEKIEQKKFKVIYSDTDSVFVETNLDKDKAQKVGLEIQDYINNFYNDYIRKKYDRNSFLELEFEKQYISMLIPMLRSKEGDEEDKKAAKKRYAGLIYHKDKKEELEIVGLEAIRGDWTDAAGDFQRELLLKVFRKQEVASFIKEYVKKVKDGKLDDKLLYRKSIRKELQEYTKTTPPHVKAARKLDKLDSNIIEYYITLDGPEPVQKLTHKLDYEHYIEKQIKPIANQVLNLFDKNFDDILKGSKQKKLF